MRHVYPKLVDKTVAPKFSIADNVRITKRKKTFDNKYFQRWTGEVISISQIQMTIPVTYKITVYNGEEFQCSFLQLQDMCNAGMVGPVIR